VLGGTVRTNPEQIQSRTKYKDSLKEGGEERGAQRGEKTSDYTVPHDFGEGLLPKTETKNVFLASAGSFPWDARFSGSTAKRSSGNDLQ